MKIKLKMILFIIPVLIILVTGGIMISGCSTFCAKSEPGITARIEKSPHYDREQEKFVNRRPKIVAENMRKNFSFLDMIKWFRGTEFGVPARPLPEVKPDISKFGLHSEHVKIIWFGHSSVLLNVSRKIIFIDPVFSGSASPFSFMVKRFQKPVLDLNELPEIDYIVISHDHYDHLDKMTIKYFRDKKTEFLVPLGVGSYLRDWGIDSRRITELDWWENTKKDKIEFIAAPSQHFSGRGLFNRDSTLWASWIIKTGKISIFFSGDSGYDIHFSEIGRKYGPFDIAFIETGQYNEKWKEVHMLPEEAAQAYFDLKAKKYIPVHWCMFELAMHPWFQPAADIAKEADLSRIDLVTPMLGEIVTLDNKLKTGRWWEPLVAGITGDAGVKMDTVMATAEK